MGKGKKRKFYAVAAGRTTGIFDTWDECQAQVKGFSRPVFKSFTVKEDAKSFLEMNSSKKPASAASHQLSGKDTPGAVAKCQSSLLSIKVNFDGGSRGNPGLAGAGAVIVVDSSNSAPSSEITTIQARHFLGTNQTNNVAEYTGLRVGLEHARDAIVKFIKCLPASSVSLHPGVVKVSVLGDSNLIISQLNGSNQCKSPKLKPLFQSCRNLVDEIKAACHQSSDNTIRGCIVDFCHVYRKDNSEADGLANEAMDERRSWVTSYMTATVEGCKGVIATDDITNNTEKKAKENVETEEV